MNVVESPRTDPTSQMGAAVPPDMRLTATMVAIGISFALAVAGIGVADFGYIPGTVGLPVVAVLAWQMGPELVAADGRRALAIALWFAGRTVVVTAVLAVLVFTVVTMAAGLGWVVNDHAAIETPFYAVVGAIVLLAIALCYLLAGLAFIGLPMLALVVPAALVWAVIVRAIAARETPGLVGLGAGAASHRPVAR